MKHPLWLINAVLIILIIAALGFLVVSRPTIPKQARLESTGDAKGPKRVIPKIDLATIYNNDLFGTYKEPLAPVQPPEVKTPMPQPPQPKPVRVPLAAPARFLEPLKIALKGIIIVSDETENTAIIELSTTKETKNYQIGDKLEDAQLLRIMKNKVIFIRSNGQQETLYVNQHDAEIDQLQNHRTEWNEIARKIDATTYDIAPDAFSGYIKNLADLIDTFNLTTVYAKGVSVGVRVGKLDPKALPLALGLAHGDVITHINSIPATTTDNRFTIYQEVTHNPTKPVVVMLTRDNEPITITYNLKPLDKKASVVGGHSEPTPQETRQEKIKTLKEHKQFAPTINELEKQEKRDILQHGQASDRRNQNVLFNSVK